MRTSAHPAEPTTVSRRHAATAAPDGEEVTAGVDPPSQALDLD
ncbi:hypothetical protein [Cellulosimicrobium composti]|nr:hypothetical protein L603_000200000360 [Cellulosimicrobium cellulans J34]SME93119.1 hypothetical protein SAMN02744115_00421 [Cellulosimicrobium cellulans J1]